MKVLRVANGEVRVDEERTVTMTSYTTTTLTPGTEYRFTVTSVGNYASTNSPESDVIIRATRQFCIKTMSNFENLQYKAILLLTLNRDKTFTFEARVFTAYVGKKFVVKR